MSNQGNDRFPYQPDGMRFENDTTADRIGEWLARDYGAPGYRIIRVPVLPVNDRLTFVLEALHKPGLA
jgi:predicted ATPase